MSLDDAIILSSSNHPADIHRCKPCMHLASCERPMNPSKAALALPVESVLYPLLKLLKARIMKTRSSETRLRRAGQLDAKHAA